jgi:hypothetical protein
VNRYFATTALSSGLGAKVCSTFSHFSCANTGVAHAKKRERISLALLLLGLRKTSRQDLPATLRADRSTEQHKSVRVAMQAGTMTPRFRLEVVNDPVDTMFDDCLI